MNEEKEYILSRIRVKAVKSDGGAFYIITMPDGETLRVLADVFETVAVEVKE